MPVFTEGRGVPFPRWQIEEDPSLMLMQINAPTNAEHPDVLRYAHMLSEALFKQGHHEPKWWKYPRGTRRFNKIYGTKFSSKVPRGVVTGMPRRTAQPRKSHARKHDSTIAPSNLNVHMLSSEQLKALRAFANANGAQWKSKLNVAWSTGRYDDYPGTDEYGYLQQIRNTFGPSWLTKFSFNSIKTHSVKW